MLLIRQGLKIRLFEGTDFRGVEGDHESRLWQAKAPAPPQLLELGFEAGFEFELRVYQREGIDRRRSVEENTADAGSAFGRAV